MTNRLFPRTPPRVLSSYSFPMSVCLLTDLAALGPRRGTQHLRWVPWGSPALHRLSGWAAQAQQLVHRLRCPVACGTLVPWPRIGSESPSLQGRFWATGPPGKSPSPFSCDAHCQRTGGTLTVMPRSWWWTAPGTQTPSDPLCASFPSLGAAAARLSPPPSWKTAVWPRKAGCAGR